jgi:hypothetical protein
MIPDFSYSADRSTNVAPLCCFDVVTEKWLLPLLPPARARQFNYRIASQNGLGCGLNRDLPTPLLLLLSHKGWLDVVEKVAHLTGAHQSIIKHFW